MTATLAAMGLTLAAVTTKPVAADVVYTPLAYTGQQVPGADPGVLFGTFSRTYNRPRINNTGQVMFTATLAGAGVDESNDGGLWITDIGASDYTLLGRQGEPAPGAPDGVTFGPTSFVGSAPYILGRRDFTDIGRLVFWADLAGPGVDDSNNKALWTGSVDAGLSIVARTGDQAAGMSDDVVYSNLFRSPPAINESGDVVFSGQVSGPGITHLANDDALWKATSAGVELFVQAGEPAPETGERFLAHYSNGFAATYHDDGELQIWSWLSENGTADLGDQGVWSGQSAASLALDARTGDPAPELDTGVVLGNPYLRPTTTSGTFGFFSSMSGPGVTSGDNRAIWIGDANGVFELIARVGDPTLPGGSDDFYSHHFIGNPVLNQSGQFAFVSQWDHVAEDFQSALGVLTGTSADDLQLVVGGDHPIPGLDPAARINEVVGQSINDAGQLLVIARYKSDPFSDRSAGTGIWAFDPETGVKLLFNTGDQLEVAPGDVRTVQRFDNSSYGSSLSDGSRRGLTDTGEFVFTALFTDGSEGIFAAQLHVPEPASIVMLTMGALALAGRRSRSMPVMSRVATPR